MTNNNPPAVPNKSVLWGAGLLLLSIGWGFGILRLDAQQLVPGRTQWGLALGTALVLTLALLAYFRLRPRPAGRPDATLSSWLVTVPLLFGYCLLSFGPLAVFAHLMLNKQLAGGPMREATLPVERENGVGGKAGDWYVVVPFEGEHPQVAVDTNPTAARTLRLTLQRGGLGYWIIRDRKTSVFAPGS